MNERSGETCPFCRRRLPPGDHRKNCRAEYLSSCSYCGAWTKADHPATCRAYFGIAAWLAEGHTQSCIALIPGPLAVPGHRIRTVEALICGIEIHDRAASAPA